MMIEIGMQPLLMIDTVASESAFPFPVDENQILWIISLIIALQKGFALLNVFSNQEKLVNIVQ